jgi:hypothetical protein
MFVQNHRYLVLFSPHPKDYPNDPPLFAAVRRATLRPWGQFVVGDIRLANRKVTVWGAYGDTGLPLPLEDLTEAQRNLLTPVPPDLTTTYWRGEGWNGPGKEATEMRAWATANLPALTRRR